MQPPVLLVFSHLRWGFVYQRPQHLLSRLARHWQVVFVEEPLQDPAHAPYLEQVQAGGVTVLVPHTQVRAPGFHDDQLSVLEPLLSAWLRAHAVEEALVWLYTPMALPLVKLVRARVLVYDCMDELAAFQGAPRQLRQRESALMKQADIVFTGGPSLYEARRHAHPRVRCIPSAVDAAHFAPECLRPGCDAALQARALQQDLPQPRLGFFGVIDERFDAGLVAALADARPGWQLVMVGPVAKIDPAALPRRPNIRWLGMQPYALLPYLLAGWDLCLMPFARNDATRFISPTKTLEYMAGGKPIVSTPIRDVAALYGSVVRFAGDAAEFAAACEALLGQTAAQRQQLVADMQALLRTQSWDGSAAAMQAEIAALAAERPALEAAAADAHRIAAAGGI